MAPQATPGRAANLPGPIVDILQRENIPQNSLGVLIQGLDDARPLLAHNLNKPFNPASVMKLLTTYAALQMLGPDFRWETEFYLDGKLKNATLSGDLIVKGYGDPYLVEETLLPVLRALRHSGLQHIKGRIIIDNSFFEESTQDPAAFDNKPYRVYNANPSAVMTNFQASRFSFIPDTEAGKVDIHVWPETPQLKIDNDMTLVKGSCRGGYRWPKMWFTNTAGKLTARFKGNYSAQCGQHDIYRAIAPPAALFYGAFLPAWRYLGGTLTKGYSLGRAPSGVEPFYTHHSKPLTEIIRLINKHSNNVMSKQLLLTLGAQSAGAPGTFDKGRQAIRRWMSSEGIDTTGLVIDNGSGLSRDARISANTLSQLARHQWRSPWMPEMLSSLSIMGRDGTSKDRFNQHPLQGAMHIKTGIIDHARSMAGIFQSKAGKRYIVISLHNYPDIHKLTGTKIQDALLKWLDNLAD